MTNLNLAIQQLFPTARPTVNFMVATIKGVPAITYWNVKDGSGNPVANPMAGGTPSDALVAADAAAQLSAAQAAKGASLTASYNATLAAGITVASEGVNFVLPAQESDQTKFAQLVVLFREAENLLPESEQAAFEAGNVSISDITGAVRTLTVTQMRQVMVAYGQQINTLWAALAAKKAAVAAAATVDAVNAIT